MKIGLNGFGRIGRHIVRSAIKRGVFGNEFDLVAINYSHSAKKGNYLLKYDSSQGTFNIDLDQTEEDDFIINGKIVKKFSKRDPAEIDWKSLDVDVVLECTGVFTKKIDAIKHIDAGAKKVIISAPSKDADKTIVYGVNHNEYDRQNHHVISNASCTTNCLAPIVKVLDENFKLQSGYMTTVHAYTGDQLLIDGNHKKDVRRGRAAAVSIVPTSTGAASAIGQVLPNLKGKLDGIALRVPTATGSVVDLNCILESKPSKEEINEAMKKASENELKEVLQYNDEEIVSCDIIGNPYSSIFDPTLTMSCNFGSKVFSWYDNEYGYSNRMIDLVLKVI